MIHKDSSITCIIPAYNSADFISDALNSVIKQTYTNWKLIVVDDASTDNTFEIVSRYAERYPDKIYVIRHTTNMGAGVARQTAIDLIDTEYATFLDSDDTLEPDFFEMNIMLAHQHDSDIVYTSFNIVYDVDVDGPYGFEKKQIKQTIPSGDFILSGEATPQSHYIAQKKFLTGKLFKTELLRKIRFSPKRVGEDVQTLFFLTYLADKVRTSSYAGYNHRFREGSLLANAPYFLCYVGSTAAEIEMIEFLHKHKDEKQLRYVLTNTYRNWLQVRKAIAEGQIDPSEYEKHKKEYEDICKWFADHRDLVLKYAM